MINKQTIQRMSSITLLVILLFTLFLSTALGEDLPEPGTELLNNGDFSGPLKFQLYKESGGNAAISIADGELLVDVSKIGRVTHAIQPYYDGFKLFEGCEYVLSFDAHSTLPRDMFVRIQLNGGDYHAYFEQNITVSEEPQHFSFPFVMGEASDPAPRLCVNMGITDTMTASGLQPEDIAPHQVYFDNFSLTVKDTANTVISSAEAENDPIRLNQEGYLPGNPKTAVIAGSDAESFAIIDNATGETVLEGTLSAPVDNPYAGEIDRVADFSALDREGEYVLQTSDGAVSPVFPVGEDVYENLLKESLRMLYLQRCGSELGSAHAGLYAHPACHSDLALIYGTDQLIDVSGGWHDAGDYGRYIVPGAKTAADLLLSYEMNPVLIDNIDIPESGDGIDDRLQEVLYELEWMLKMQAENGGVYHKVTGRGFPGFVKPQEETDQMVVLPISNTATGDFAAVMALAARIYSGSGIPELEEYSETFKNAAERAWDYLEEHKNDPGFTNPPDVTTGEYPDGKCDDERFWAAAELARVTGEDKYRLAVLESLTSGRVTAEFGWVEAGGYGLYAVLTDPNLSKDDEAYGPALNLLRDAAAKAGAVIHSHPYAVNRTDNYEWGSNMGIANDGVMLLIGASVLEDESLREDASRQLDYLLGENATGYCYVTGFGAKSPEHPHHRPSIAFGAPVPGMLVGGPDSSLEDPYAQSVLADSAPAKRYADSDQSYSTNEICIYWNSPLILLISGLTANH